MQRYQFYFVYANNRLYGGQKIFFFHRKSKKTRIFLCLFQKKSVPLRPIAYYRALNNTKRYETADCHTPACRRLHSLVGARHLEAQRAVLQPAYLPEQDHARARYSLRHLPRPRSPSEIPDALRPQTAISTVNAPAQSPAEIKEVRSPGRTKMREYAAKCTK